MKKVNKLLLPLVCIMTLVGCGPNDVPLVDIVDIKTSFVAMAQKDNYLVETFDSSNKKVFSGQYHQNYYYESVNNKGYLVKNNAVYPFHFDGTNVVNKEALNVASLYGQDGAMLGAKDIDLTIIPDAKNTFATMKKGVAIPLLELCGYQESMYGSLNACKMDYENKNLTITFNFSTVVPGEGLKEYSEVAKISKIGEINLPLVEDFITNGELTKLDADLIRIRDLFALDNYTQYQSDGTGITQVDMFNPNYFVTVYTDYAISVSPVLKMNQIGYLTIVEPDKTLDLFKDDKGQPIPLIYDDTFYYQYLGTYEQPGDVTLITRKDPKRHGYASGAFQEIVRDVTTAFHYPKGLKIFKNLDDLNKIKGHNAYSCLDKGLIDNLLADYSLTGAFDEFGGIEEIQFIYELAKADADCKVTIRLVSPLGYYDLAYDNFGSTQFKPFEDILASIK